MVAGLAQGLPFLPPRDGLHRSGNDACAVVPGEKSHNGARLAQLPSKKKGPFKRVAQAGPAEGWRPEAAPELICPLLHHTGCLAAPATWAEEASRSRGGAWLQRTHPWLSIKGLLREGQHVEADSAREPCDDPFPLWLPRCLVLCLWGVSWSQLHPSEPLTRRSVLPVA